MAVQIRRDINDKLNGVRCWELSVPSNVKSCFRLSQPPGPSSRRKTSKRLAAPAHRALGPFLWYWHLMCNLYSITTNQEAIRALFRVINRYVGNLPPMTGVFPDYPAPVVRNAGAEREMALMRWGMPPPPRTGGPPVTNIRNTSSPHWRGWLNPRTGAWSRSTALLSTRRSRTRRPRRRTSSGLP
jgi:hypothetical protein